ncbi:hypothetical protein NQ315_004152 [Exocentrus adspersus]|uniref:Cellulase n=1 Tax=Exocentrus adspersus TaxID=1586481 RepID=A0AAV8W784_9CUCU|nr:hypothetical protein NQ315_004152 [Exocentrus adspersus]
MKFLLLTLAVLYTAVSAEKHIHLERIPHGLSGEGRTTRYWDCCKPSCGWSDNLKDKSGTPVNSCLKDGSTVAPANAESSCIGGDAFMCSNQVPRAVNSSFALGYAAASFQGGADTSYCCACVKLTFHDALQGKEMVVQVTNTGGDLGSNQFDLAIPGGGLGIFTDGCTAEFGSVSGWGEQYGGVSSAEQCSGLPSALQSGCKFRFEWMQGASNPSVSFEQVSCPGDLSGATGCNYS